MLGLPLGLSFVGLPRATGDEEGCVAAADAAVALLLHMRFVRKAVHSREASSSAFSSSLRSASLSSVRRCASALLSTEARPDFSSPYRCSTSHRKLSASTEMQRKGECYKLISSAAAAAAASVAD